MKGKTMKTIKNKQSENQDTDKTHAKAGIVSEKNVKVEKQIVFPDTIIAEKDEVKNAEERMRQIRKKDSKEPGHP